MSTRTAPPFRADHVGSLLRPRSLLEARSACEQGRITAAELRRREDDAIRDAIRLQQDVGLRAITDGELRRGSWHMDFVYQIGGVERGEETTTSHFRNDQGTIEFTPSKA